MVNLDYGHIKSDITAIKLHHHQSLMVFRKAKIVSVTTSSFRIRHPEEEFGAASMDCGRSGS